MKWNIILYLSLLGLAMAFAAVYFIPEHVEHYIWILIFVICGVVIARNADKKFFLNGFVLGIIDTALTVVIRSFCYSRYVALNPGIQSRDIKILATGVTPQIAMMLSAPFIAVFTGIVQGSFALIISRFTRNGRSSQSPLR